ncbi:hypothetical protein NAF17_15090 [Mucilaginibacter sp. RB4R14]|uniref:hypothetical protein n=1 Tax=Mucilaginibacter aurantiaciroseus TaxID=2949308 RepID=UPI002091B550|nr:hypothetical protein [Mucilaginibacter aurantiaciroseus]MCO5936867.1 hypothetical protein [Mucilaginibacter aurantiaciroseus]
MIINKIKSINDLISASFRYITYKLSAFAFTNGIKNTKNLNFTEVYTLKGIVNNKKDERDLLFFKNTPQTGLNTATVYINGSNYDLIKPASAYRLYSGLMLLPRHLGRKHRANL